MAYLAQIRPLSSYDDFKSDWLLGVVERHIGAWEEDLSATCQSDHHIFFCLWSE